MSFIPSTCIDRESSEASRIRAPPTPIRLIAMISQHAKAKARSLTETLGLNQGKRRRSEVVTSSSKTIRMARMRKEGAIARKIKNLGPGISFLDFEGFLAVGRRAYEGIH